MLTIDAWIEKALASAVDSAVDRHARAQHYAAITAANVLSTLPDDELNTQLLSALGSADKLAEIDKEAAQSGANVKSYKALILANQHPRIAAALVRRLKGKGK